MAAYRGRLGSNPSITAVFFDLDNTLIETRKGDSMACRKLTEELSLKYGIAQDESSRITATYLKQFRKCPDNPAYNLDTWRKSIWLKALGDIYSCLADDIYARWLCLRYRYLALGNETIAMLREMRKKYHLGLITNGPSNAQWEKIRKLDLQQYFDVVLVSGDLPWEKPQAYIFEEACRCLGVAPNDCLMVGDKLETDILGGINANFAGTVWLPLTEKTRLTLDDPKPKYTIKRITDLLAILKVRGPGAPELEDSSSNASDGS